MSEIDNDKIIDSLDDYDRLIADCKAALDISREAIRILDDLKGRPIYHE